MQPGLPADGGLLRTEVVSLTFLEAWRKPGRIEADEPLRPWLLGIEVNVSRNLAQSILPQRCTNSPRS